MRASLPTTMMQSTEEQIHTAARNEAEEREAAIVQLVHEIRAKQNLALGTLGGLAGAVVGAVVWAAISYATHLQIGYMSIGLGLLVGFGVRTLGRGIDREFGVTGAFLALLGCIAGNIGIVAIALSAALKIPMSHVIARMTPEVTWMMFKSGFQAMDVLFYALAVWAGYRYAFRPVTDDEVRAKMAESMP